MTPTIWKLLSVCAWCGVEGQKCMNYTTLRQIYLYLSVSRKAVKLFMECTKSTK